MADAKPDSCAVCFDDVLPGESVQLPCACRVPYCLPCWEQSLNVKFSQTRSAQCPTCRSAVRVDFDHQQRKLTFSKLPPGELDMGMRNRLYDQARPLQVRLLREFDQSRGPECVCGSRLLQQSFHKRVWAYVAWKFETDLQTAEGHSHCQAYAEQLLAGSRNVPIYCDSCDKPMEADANVWTCEQASETLLHGLAYDVCTSCFDQLTGCAKSTESSSE